MLRTGRGQDGVPLLNHYLEADNAFEPGLKTCHLREIKIAFIAEFLIKSRAKSLHKPVSMHNAKVYKV